jgi:flagellar assembly factor FliW
MKISTTRFGQVEVPDEVLLRFPEGVLGFPNDRTYVLMEHDMDNSPFKWLQSVETADLAFIVIDPLMLVNEYPVMIDADTARMIELHEGVQCAFMAVVNVPKDQPIAMTANLKAPLVVNPETRLGRQVILGSQAFSLQEPVFPRLNERLQAVGNPGSMATA